MIDSWIPLVSVFIGSFVAYYGLHTNEEKKRRFELKREAYVNFLDILKEGTMVFASKETLNRPKTPEEINNDANYEKNKKNMLVNGILWLHNLNKALIMIDLCGGEKVIELAHEDIAEMLEEHIKKQDSDRYVKFESDLISAIREDLLGEHYRRKHIWQFWK